LIHGQWLGSPPSIVNTVGALDPSVGGIASREEENSLAVGKYQVTTWLWIPIAVAEGLCAPLKEGKVA